MHFHTIINRASQSNGQMRSILPFALLLGFRNSVRLCQGFSTARPPLWKIHRTIEKLQKDETSVDPVYLKMSHRVAGVLQNLVTQHSNDEEWQSLLKKSNLFHEVEESIVALHHLYEWTLQRKDPNNGFIAVDACCGKGIFSTLLSFLAPTTFPQLDRIILFDKDQKINWSHIRAANNNDDKEQRPFLELLPATNLYETNDMFSKLDSQPLPLAVTGIHLCKNLSPTLVGLVNGLGPSKVPYMCLAPCCLPQRRGKYLPIYQYEEPVQRHARLEALSLRQTAKLRRRSKCYMCQDYSHHVRDCPQRQSYDSDQDWNAAVDKAIANQPCWQCGQVGHRQNECPTPPAKKIPQQPVSMLDIMQIYERPDPFTSYCDVLAEKIQGSIRIQIHDSGLVSSTNGEHSNGENWNRFRKSLYIVVTR